MEHAEGRTQVAEITSSGRSAAQSGKGSTRPQCLRADTCTPLTAAESNAGGVGGRSIYPTSSLASGRDGLTREPILEYRTGPRVGEVTGTRQSLFNQLSSDLLFPQPKKSELRTGRFRETLITDPITEPEGQPANQSMKPIYTELQNVEIQGRVLTTISRRA